MALADLTVGKRFGSDNIEDVKPGEFDDIYTKGRLAFYVKGKIKGRYFAHGFGRYGRGQAAGYFQGP